MDPTTTTPYLPAGTVLLRSEFPKIVSPTIQQDLKAFGVAQVIVVLQQFAGGGLRADAVAVQSLESCFRTSELSQVSAIRRTMRLGGAASAVGVPEPTSITYSNLGVMLGTVDIQGLAALQSSDHVAAICGTPQISLIRPERVAAASAPSGVTWGIGQLGVPALWKQGLTGKGIAVGHLDTGVDARHPALQGAVTQFADFELSLGQRRQPDPAPFDSGEHGTHTAGTIAGRPIAGRHIGVAHGAELHSGVVIEGGNAVARVLGGFNWVIGTGVKIVSMSAGFRGWLEDFIPIIQILRSRGILPIVAVGNEGPGTSRSPGNYPAVLSVGADDETPAVAPFSSSQVFARAQDPLVPDLVAPGVNVISAAPGGSFQSMSGSSMATPHVSGLAALLWEARPEASATEIEQAIFASCRLFGRLTADRANRGQPDAVAAFTRLTGIALPPAAAQVAVPGTVRAAGPKVTGAVRPTSKAARNRKATKKMTPATRTQTGVRKVILKKAGAKRR